MSLNQCEVKMKDLIGRNIFSCGMDRSHLDTLVRLGEGFTVEFKRSGTSNIGRELCAFTNTTGGALLIGITDKSEVCGVANHKSGWLYKY